MAVSILAAQSLSQRKLQHYHVKSKDEFQSELELPRGPGRGNLPGRVAIGVIGAAARENNRIRVEEIRVIEHIERLRPELQVKLLVDTELLEKRSVGVDQTGSPDPPARDVPRAKYVVPCGTRPRPTRPCHRAPGLPTLHQEVASEGVLY